MNPLSAIVLGGTGLVGSAVCRHMQDLGHRVVPINSSNYEASVGASAEALINCNGNSFRFKANQNPRWDFDASVLSVEKSLYDFHVNKYIHISTVDVYSDLGDPRANGEDARIDPLKLTPYGFHKWQAERLVERFGRQPLILRLGTVIGPGLKKGPLFDLLQGGPLHMSLESELALIDTDTIARAVGQFLANPPSARILNVVGTGTARLGEICRLAGMEPGMAPGAEAVTHSYHLNNDRFRALFPVSTSLEIAARFLAGVLQTKT